jgi:ABC-type phosphate/phosphonate transport system substrate-binding protein
MATAAGKPIAAVAMRDTDRDLTSVVLVRTGSGVNRIEDLQGRTVAFGAVDSPQATLLPLAHLIDAGVPVAPRRFDVGVGMHGDHIGGERDAARALMAGEVDAACVIDANHVAFIKEGTLRSEDIQVIAQTEPYDHCNLTTVRPEAEGVRRLGDLLFSMSYADAELRPLLDLEGLTHWERGRTSGYRALERAVEVTGFYSADGRIASANYRP